MSASFIRAGYGDCFVHETIPRGLSPEAQDDFATRIVRQLVTLINAVDPADVAVPEAEASNAADPEAT